MKKQNIFKNTNKLYIAILGGIMLLSAIFGLAISGSTQKAYAASSSEYWEQSSSGSSYWNSTMTAPLQAKHGSATDLAFAEFLDNMPYGYNIKSPSSYNVWYDIYGVSLRTKIGDTWYVQDYYNTDEKFSTTGYNASNVNLSQYFNFIEGVECEAYAYALQKYSGVFYRSNIIKFTPATLLENQSVLAPTASITYKNVDSVPSDWQTSYTRHDTFNLPIPATKNDYAFDGWYTTSDFSGSAVTSVIGLGGNKIFYAKWKYVYDLIPLPPDPTKTGYIFIGWYYDSSFESAYDGKPIYSNTKLYAKFDAITYSITYNTNGGTLSGQTTSYTIESEKVVLITPSRIGYDFKGWYDNASLSGTEIAEIESGSLGNLEYWAKWEIQKFTITFYVDDKIHSEMVVEYGTMFNEFYLVNKATLEIVPLFLDSSLTTTFDVETAIVENTAFYTSADFSIFVSLTYVVNDNEIAVDLLEYNALLNNLRSPEVEGMTFEAWFYDKACTKQVIATDKLTSNITIYAKLIETQNTNLSFGQKVGKWFGSAAGIATVVITAVVLVLGGVGYGVYRKKKA